VSTFYDAHPYPPPVDDLVAHRREWNDERRRAEFHLLWPGESYRDDRTILIAGCGTVQAARYAVRWPNATIVGIDVSARSLEFGRQLARKHAIENLELHELPVERASELERAFDQIVCTGVLHHVADPQAGLAALREVMAPEGALHIMVYAPYGRSGIYMLQDFFRRLGWGDGNDDVAALAATLKALPADHPIVPLLRHSPDFSSTAGLADALLHPQDRAYTVAQFFEFLQLGGLRFGRWVRQAPYLPACGALASTPRADRLEGLSVHERYAAMELFRGTMVRHSAIAHRSDSRVQSYLDFETDESMAYVPVRAPETVVVREGLPAGATAVLINRRHAYTDLYLPIDGEEDRLFAAVDGRRSIGSIGGNAAATRAFFQRLWEWDHVVIDTTKVGR